MYVVVISLIILLAILLVLVILAQNSKGGLSSQFGGGGASQVMGVKKASDLLEKLTWGFAIGIMGLVLLANVLSRNTEQENFEAPNIEKATGISSPLQGIGGNEESGSSEDAFSDLTDDAPSQEEAN